MHLQNYSMQKLLIPNKYSLPEEFLGKQYFLKKKLFLETYVFRGFPIMHLQNYLLQTNIHYKKKYCKKYIDGRKKNIAKNIHCKTIFIAKKYSLPEEFLGEKVYSLQRVSIEASLLFALAKTPNPPTA